jgi:hypothetical protein
LGVIDVDKVTIDGEVVGDSNIGAVIAVAVILSVIAVVLIIAIIATIVYFTTQKKSEQVDYSMY